MRHEDETNTMNLLKSLWLSKSGDSFLGLWELPKTFQVSIYLSNLSWPHKISFQPGCKGSSSLRVKVSIVDPPRDFFFSYWGHQKSIPTQNKDHRNVHNKILPCFFFHVWIPENRSPAPFTKVKFRNWGFSSRPPFENPMSGENPRKQKEVRFFLPHTQWFKVCCVLKKKTAKPRLRRHSLRRFFFFGRWLFG